VTVFSGTLTYGYVVDNAHIITDDYGLHETILLDQDHAPGIVFHVPTDAITSDDGGRVLIGDIPEPATAALLVFGGGAAVLGRLRRRKRR